MAFSDLSNRLTDLSAQLDTKMPDVLAVSVMSELMAMHKKRIFDDGLNTKGEQIGEYSTGKNKDGEQVGAYYSESDFVRKSAFKPQGKDPKNQIKTSVFDISTKKKKSVQIKKNYTERKTMFLPKGYSEFRDIQGRKTDYINFKLSGSLEAGINVVKNDNSALYGTTSAFESNKFEGLEERFDGVFGLTLVEQQFLKDEITDQAIVIASKP